MAPRSAQRLFIAFLVLAVCALCVLAVLLTRQNRRLRADNEMLAQALLREQTRSSLGIGESLDPLAVFSPDGSERTLAFAGQRPSLVLLSSGDCPHCTETLPIWGRILEQTGAASSEANPTSIVLVQIDADRPDQLKLAIGLRVPGLSPVGVKEAATTWLRKIPISPAALWVDRDGTVRHAWYGVPSQRDQGEMATALLGGTPGK